jgi:hypothetical protein
MINKTKHKAVLWPVVMDLKPISYVNNPGTQMQFRLLDPSYVVLSSLFYRNLLDKVGLRHRHLPLPGPEQGRAGHGRRAPHLARGRPPSTPAFYTTFPLQMYANVLQRVKDQVEAHSPTNVNVMLDGWSAFQHGYIGAVMTYIYDWKRYFVCFGCKRFDLSHSGANLGQWMKGSMDEWKVTDITDTFSTDTAANMKKMMQYLHRDSCDDATCESCFTWGGCIAHIFNLVIKDDLFSGTNIKSMIAEVKSLVTTYHQSNNFATAFRQTQMEVMDKTEDECLAMHQDVDTRWNSIYLMLARLAC